MKRHRNLYNQFSWLIAILTLCFLAGCAGKKPLTEDPWQNWNQKAQVFNDQFDQNVLTLMAKGYLWLVPAPFNHRVSDFFSNINDISVAINQLLQLKPMDSGKSLGRFIINSTLGFAGMMDVAMTMGLAKQQEDFAQTLAVWGLSSGPYLVLPFLGPGSPRAIAGKMGDIVLDPLNYILFLGVPGLVSGSVADVIDVTDRRANLMRTEKIFNEASFHRYEFIKNTYLQNRNFLINDGSVAEEVFFLENEF